MSAHSCHARCREPLCMLRREKDLRAERDRLREALKDVEMAPRVLHFDGIVGKMQAIAARALEQRPVQTVLRGDE